MLIDKKCWQEQKMNFSSFAVACNWQLPISEREKPEVTSIVLQQEEKKAAAKQQLYQKNEQKSRQMTTATKNEELSDSHLQQQTLPTNKAQLTGKDINFKTQQN